MTMDLTDLIALIKSIRSKEEDLDQKEKIESEKLNELKRKIENDSATLQDIQGNVENLINEAEETRDLAEAIFNSENKLNEFDKEAISNDDIEIPDELMEANNAEEEIIDHFQNEISKLENQFNSLESLYNRFKVKDNLKQSIDGKMENLERIIQKLDEKVNEVSEAENNLEINRRRLLKVAGAGGAAVLGASLSINEDMDRTEKFLMAYLEEINSWKSGGLKLRNNIVIGERHTNTTSFSSLIDILIKFNPDAVGLEFFYEKDESLEYFNKGDISIKSLSNHWERNLGYKREEKKRIEFLEVCREKNIKIIGLEPEKPSTYIDWDPVSEITYEKRAKGMSSNAFEVAESNEKSVFLVGNHHAGLKAGIPEDLLKSGQLKFEDKFNLKEFYKNPLIYSKFYSNEERDGSKYYKNPNLRINYKLKQNNLKTSLVRATSVKEQKRIFENQYQNYEHKTEKMENLKKEISATLNELKKSQPVSGRSKSGFNIILRKED